MTRIRYVWYIDNMYVDESITTSKTGKKYRRVLLRTSYWDKELRTVRHKTLLNLSKFPEEEVRALKLALKYKNKLSELMTADEIKLQQGKRIGAVWTAIEVGRRIGIESALGKGKEGRLAFFQVIVRLIEQGSRLSAVRFAQRHGIAELLEIETLNEDKLYKNLEWLSKNQEKIEKKLYQKRYPEGKPQLFLYDVTSSYLEGEHNELAEYGYNRDKKKGKKQIVIGLLTDGEGMPVAVRVFKGNTSDTKTVSEQIRILKEEFGAEHITLVGDRGMLKGPQIKELPDDFWYITAISKPQIRKLMEKGAIQLELFDETVTEVEYEGVRYILRRNPSVQEKIRRKREDKYDKLKEFVKEKNKYLREHERAKVEVALREVNERIERAEADRWLKAKIEGREIVLVQDEEALQELQKLDGCYVIKSNVKKESAEAQTIHDRYLDLKKIENDFRIIKQTHLQVRPLFVRKESHTKGHVLVVMLALLIQRALEQYWKSLDIGVKEGLNELSSISMMTVKLRDTVVNKVPEPSKLGQQLLEAADVVIPEYLPIFESNIYTKKKLSR